MPRRRVDVVFPGALVACAIHGCFWHGCTQHATWPKANAEWWRHKIERNRARDAETRKRFQAAGWTYVEVWEHEDPVAAADRVEAAVRFAANPDS